VKRILPWLLLLATSCQGLPGRPPSKAEFDPAGSDPGRPEGAAVDAKTGDEILAQHTKRFRDGYPIYPGDELRFTVLGQADLTLEARVPAEGSINYPLIGKTTLAGRTLEEVRREVKERLEKDYLVSADVSVLVKEYARKRVYVLGAVAKPLDYEVPSGRLVTLLQAVAQAGGFLEDAAKHGVVIYRPRAVGSSERLAIPVDVSGAREVRDPLLLPDDIVFVPARERVYVSGQVAHPGAFVVNADHGLTASQAVSLAGGFTRIANDANVRLIRRLGDGGRRTFVLNLARVVAGHPEEDVPLQPGDTLFVPESVF
jgi:polysaccharide biosynthesis/export protein